MNRAVTTFVHRPVMVGALMAALAAALLAVPLARPASAATPSCQGKVATIDTLRLSLSKRRVDCDEPTWVGDHAEAELAAAADRTSDVVVTCTKQRKGASVRVTASLFPVESEPLATNDVDSSQTNVR